MIGCQRPGQTRSLAAGPQRSLTVGQGTARRGALADREVAS